jgi:CHAT domain-containing protein/tetratricopeptide (TPR) repeat protein
MKTILNLTSAFLCAVFLFGALDTHAQYQKFLDKADVEYTVGDYASAQKIIAKMKKTVTKKLGTRNSYLAIALMQEARINLELGLLNDVEKPLNEALEMSYAVNDTLSAEHAFMLKEASEVMIQYGNFRLARKYLNLAVKAFEASDSMIDVIKAETDAMDAKIKVGRGFNQEAIKLVDGQLDFYRTRALNAPKNEQERKMADYAELLTVRAQAYAQMGDVDKATQLFLENKNWIRDNLGKKHILYAWNTYSDVEMMGKHGLSLEAQAIDYEDAFYEGKKKYEETHWMVLLMNERLMSALYRNENKGKFGVVENMYKSAIREFGRNSMHHLSRQRMDMELALIKGDLKKLELEVNSLLANPIVPKFHRTRIELLEFAKTVGILTNQYKNVEGYDQQILSIQENLLGTEAPEYHLTKIKLANYLVDYTDKILEAKSIYINSFHAVVEKEITRKHEDYLDILNHLAAFYEETDDYKKASQILDDALLAAREKYDNTDIAYAHELEKIANLQIKIGEYKKATENLDEAMRLLNLKKKEEEAQGYLVGALITEAKLFSIKGEYDRADDNLYASEKIQSKTTLSLTTSSMDQADDKASLYTNVGRYSDAEQLLSISLKNKEAQFGNQSRQLNETLALYSRLKLLKGDYTEAEKMARRSNAISVGIFGEKSTKIVPSVIALADVYITIGDFDKAESLLKQAIKIQTSRFGKDHADVGKSTSQLALVNFYQGKPIDEVQKQFGEAERVIGASLGSNNPTYAEILKNMAIANIAAGNYSIADQYLNDANKIWSQKIGSRNNINVANVALLKGDINYRQKRYAQAESFYNDALKQYQKVFSSKHPEYVKVQAKLSKTYYMQGDYKRSQEQMEAVLVNYKTFIAEYFPALSEREKAKFWNTIKSNYEFYNTLIVSRNRSSKYYGEMFNNALLTKALLLNSSIKIRQRIMSSNDQELITMYSDWVDKKELLTSALSMGSEQLAENGINTSNLTDEVEALEKKISERSEDFSQGADTRPVTWEDVRNSLKENEVAIEMVRFRYFNHDFTDSVMYAVLYVKGGKRSEPELILLNNGDDLENKFLKNFRNRIKFKLADEISYDQFWKPIVDKVGAVSTVYLSPDGVYNQVNLEAISTPDGKYVLDNSNIVLLSNTKDLYYDKLRPEKPSTTQNVDMFGNPQFYVRTTKGVPVENSGMTRSTIEVIADLPGTKRELDELKSLLDRKGWTVESKTEKSADEPSVKAIDNPRIFHVATHGFFQDDKKVARADDELNEGAAYENPLLKTGLLLAGAGDILNETKYNYNLDNGILTAYEAMNLNLDKTDLVVLSACETGLGEIEAGEGVYGLQRAFLVAGARTIIMSLFKVSDEATQQLMVKFYRKWIETGNKRQAFIDAKKEIRNEYKDPIYWGPFIMIGLE